MRKKEKGKDEREGKRKMEMKRNCGKKHLQYVPK